MKEKTELRESLNNLTTSLLLKLPISIVLSIINLIVRGFAIMKIWEWFIVPEFNLDNISLIGASGLYFVVRLLTLNTSSDNNTDSNGVLKRAFYRMTLNVSLSGLSIFVGWLFTLFM